MPVEIQDFEAEDESGGGDVVEFPVIELQRFNTINKERLIATIEKVLKVRTRYGNRYLLQTDKGDVWVPWGEVKKLANAFGVATRDWKGKRVLIKTALVKVGGELKKTVIIDPV